MAQAGDESASRSTLGGKIVNFDALHPPSWLGHAMFGRLLMEARTCWEALDQATPLSAAEEFQRIQNQGMMLKFWFEQSCGDGIPAGRTKALLEREFVSLQTFRNRCHLILEASEPDWLAWCLSFATFRFHLFPIGSSAPFCTSAMLVLCTRRDVAAEAGFTPAALLDAQLDNMDWTAVERRIACLEKPLNVFEEAVDCQVEACT